MSLWLSRALGVCLSKWPHVPARCLLPSGRSPSAGDGPSPNISWAPTTSWSWAPHLYIYDLSATAIQGPESHLSFVPSGPLGVQSLADSHFGLMPWRAWKIAELFTPGALDLFIHTFQTLSHLKYLIRDDKVLISPSGCLPYAVCSGYFLGMWFCIFTTAGENGALFGLFRWSTDVEILKAAIYKELCVPATYFFASKT